MAALLPTQLIGQSVRLTANLTVSGFATDPTSVACISINPNGVLANQTTFEDSAGNFHADVTLDTAGVWAFRWETTGPNTAGEGTIACSPSITVAPGY